MPNPTDIANAIFTNGPEQQGSEVNVPEEQPMQFKKAAAYIRVPSLEYDGVLLYLDNDISEMIDSPDAKYPLKVSVLKEENGKLRSQIFQTKVTDAGNQVDAPAWGAIKNIITELVTDVRSGIDYEFLPEPVVYGHFSSEIFVGKTQAVRVVNKYLEEINKVQTVAEPMIEMQPMEIGVSSEEQQPVSSVSESIVSQQVSEDVPQQTIVEQPSEVITPFAVPVEESKSAVLESSLPPAPVSDNNGQLDETPIVELESLSAPVDTDNSFETSPRGQRLNDALAALEADVKRAIDIVRDEIKDAYSELEVQKDKIAKVTTDIKQVNDAMSAQSAALQQSAPVPEEATVVTAINPQFVNMVAQDQGPVLTNKPVQ